MATDRRILELALKGLEAERDVIAADITELRTRLAALIAPSGARRARRAGAAAKKRRQRAVKGLEREVTRAVKKGKKKARKMTAAQRKLISKRMKETWAARRKK